jgi:uncharacterized protein
MNGPLEQMTLGPFPRFVVKRRLLSRQWYWTLLARNNRKIATSGESYRNKADCLHSIDLVKNLSNAEIE